MLYLLPTPLGNLSDITIRVLEILSVADVVLCEDTRVGKKLFSLLEKKGFFGDRNIDLSSKKFISFHSHNQDSVLSSFQSDFFDQNVVFISDAGMPCISDPGVKLVEFVRKNSIKYDVLPGPSASVLSYVFSGVDSKGFYFLGFLPHKSTERRSKIASIKGFCSKEGIALVMYESPNRILDSIADIRDIWGDCFLFAIKEMTKKHQNSYFGSPQEVLDSMRDKNLSGEWSIVAFGFCEEEKMLSKEDILSMDLAPKVKAKILSKITGITPKQCYENLLGV